MNRVQTGKHFLKKSSVLVCFDLKCLHSKHPLGQNVQVKISCAPRICFRTSPCLSYDTPATLGSFSPWSTASSPSPRRVSEPVLTACSALFLLAPTSLSRG